MKKTAQKEEPSDAADKLNFAPARQVKAFRDSNHDHLADMINEWLQQNNAITISLSVTRETNYFHAFLLYETGTQNTFR